MNVRMYVRARTVINAQARCLVVINMDQYSSDSESSEPEAGSSDVNTVRSQIFSKKITESLENLYSGGMTGWGTQHKMKVNAAMASTGLTLSQVKVNSIVSSDIAM